MIHTQIYKSGISFVNNSRTKGLTMIKKLQKHEIVRHGVVIEEQGCEPREIIDKINALVDAVKELQNIQVQVNGHELKIASVYDQLNGFRAVMRKNGWNVDRTYPEHIADVSKKIDPYTEQRKWIGKLCWFWNSNTEPDTCFGVLTGLFDEADRPFERSIGQQLYRYCKPVKPDDDIIYKKD